MKSIKVSLKTSSWIKVKFIYTIWWCLDIRISAWKYKEQKKNEFCRQKKEVPVTNFVAIKQSGFHSANWDSWFNAESGIRRWLIWRKRGSKKTQISCPYWCLQFLSFSVRHFDQCLATGGQLSWLITYSGFSVDSQASKRADKAWQKCLWFWDSQS